MVKTLLMSASLSVVMLFVPIGAFSPDPLHGFSMPSSALAAQTKKKKAGIEVDFGDDDDDDDCDDGDDDCDDDDDDDD